jgi:hypothetical protein
MKCVYHNDKEAEFVCSYCGQPICRDCTTSINGKSVCKSCSHNMHQYNQTQHNAQEGINGFLFFIFLAVPGLRHMYLGLMKRGVQFLVSFFGLITFGVLLDRLGAIVIPIVFIVWFYSAFDSYQYKKMIDKGEKAEDIPLFEEYGLDSIKDFFAKRKHASGIVIVFLGIYLFLRQLQRYTGMLRIPSIVDHSIDFAFSLFIPILLIIGGVYIIAKVNEKAEV